MAGTVVCKVKLVFSFIDHHGNYDNRLILTYKGEKAGEKKDGHADHEGETRQHQHFPARFLWEKKMLTMMEKMLTMVRSQKKNDIIWEFFPNVGPPPPFWEPLIQKKFLVFILHFRT